MTGATEKTVLFVNGHIWQWQPHHSTSSQVVRQRAPPASWLLISQPSSSPSSSSKDDARDELACSGETPKTYAGTILALGVGDAPAEHRAGSEVINLAGAVVLPGLQDAHIHIGSMGESAFYVDLSECESVQEVQQTIGQHARDNPEHPWVIGTGWDQNLWSPPNSLTRADLDDPAAGLPAGRPCLLYRRCWHSLVANTAAMHAARIDPEKPWPSRLRRGAGVTEGQKDVAANGKMPGDDFGTTVAVAAAEEEDKEDKGWEDEGGVELDEAQRPTGLFQENSMRIIEAAVTAPEFETRCEQFAEALGRCVRSGLTAVHSNDGNATEVYAQLEKEDRLPVRVYHTRDHDELPPKTPQLEQRKAATTRQEETRGGDGGDGSDAHESSGKGHGMPPKFVELKVGDEEDGVASGGRPLSRVSGDGGGLISSHRVKLFADGSLGAETAAMRVPYVNTTNSGVLIHDQAALTRKVREAKDLGLRVEVHAIGDRALEAVLDAFSGAGLAAEDRPIVTHCQVAGPDLRARMRQAGAVAAIQPSFVPSDAATVMKRLSRHVHASCYPWRSLLLEGIVCAGSSDAPIETHDPLRGMYDAIFRHTKSLPAGAETQQAAAAATAAAGTMPDIFLPDERLSLEEAVWIYTAGGAIAAGEEKRLGSIEPGFLADLTVLELEGGGAEKLLENASLLVEAEVAQVWVGGRCTWDRSAAIDGGASETVSKWADLTGSDLPGKNGPPKRKRTEHGVGGGSVDAGKNAGKTAGRRGTNVWLSGRGLGRVGRCRCCS